MSLRVSCPTKNCPFKAFFRPGTPDSDVHVFVLKTVRKITFYLSKVPFCCGHAPLYVREQSL